MKKGILIVSTAFVGMMFMSGCEEAEVLLGGNIFNMKYTQVDASIPVAQVRSWAESSASQLEANSDTFFPVEDPTTNLNPDRIILFGDPNSAQSAIEVHMNRSSGSSDYLNTIFVQLTGPFVEGQEITSGIAEVTLGGLPNQSGAITYDFDNSADSYFSFTITSLNTTTNTIGGNFHLLLTRVDDRSADPVSVYEGAFSWNLN